MTATKLSLTAAVSALVLTACAAGPDYRPPALAAPGAFVTEGPALAAEVAPPDDWWRLFDDPVVGVLVEEALAANRDLAAASANLARVRASLGEARSARLPSTSVSASAGRARQPGPTGALADTDVYSAGLDVAYEIDLFGRVGRSVEAAGAEVGAAEAALDAARVSVAAETARAYADACAAGLQIEVARRTIDLQQRTYDIARARLEAGGGAALEAASASAQLEATRAGLPQLEAQRQSALFRLAVLTGRPPAQVPAAAAGCARLPKVAAPLPAGDGTGLIRRRPDVRQAERELAAATARIGLATAGLYPQVRFGASAASVAAEASDVGRDVTFNIGPLVSWSFPNIAAARARVAQADAAAQGALARFEQANLVALREAETALTLYARELERLEALGRARAEGAEAARLARLRYDAGRDSFVTLLDAERTLAGLDAQLAQSRALTAAYQIGVFKALAGAWAPAAGS